MSTITRRSQTPPTVCIHCKWERLPIFRSEMYMYAQSTHRLFRGVKYQIGWAPICNVNAALSSVAVGFGFLPPASPLPPLPLPPLNQSGGFEHRPIIAVNAAVVIISRNLVFFFFLFYGMNRQCVAAAAGVTKRPFNANDSLPQMSSLGVCAHAVKRVRRVPEIELPVELLGTCRNGIGTYRARKNGLQNVINTTQAGLGRLV